MSSLRQSLYRGAKTWLAACYDPWISTGPVLETARWFPAESELLPLLATLRQQALALPLEQLPRFHQLSSTQGAFAWRDGRRWSVLPLRLYGVDLPANQRLLPALKPFLAAHPEVLSAMVSCLESGKHIRPHRGPFRGVLRYHLCLALEQDGGEGCWLRLNGHKHPYRQGASLLWDDTFEHEVHNRTGADRIALLLDLRRGGLPWHADLLSRLVISGVGLYCRLRRRRFERAAAQAEAGASSTP